MPAKTKRFEILFEEYNIVPQVAFCLGNAVSSEISKYGCGRADSAVTLWEGWDRQFICIDSNSGLQLAERLFIKIKAEPQFGREVVAEIKDNSDEILFHSKKNFPKDIKSISNRELYRLYQDFLDLTQKQFVSGLVPMLIEAIDGHLSGYMLQYLLDKTQDLSLANNLFSLLSTSSQKSDLKKEEADFIKLVKDNSLQGVQLERKLKSHYRKYFWIPYDFRGPGWSLDYFITRFHELKKERINWDKKLAADYLQAKQLLSRQKEIISQYQIDKKHQQLFEVLRGFLFSKPYRKGRYTHSCYYHNQVGKEIARRLNITSKQVWFLLLEETKEMLLKKKEPDVNLLNERMNYSVILSEQGVSKFIVGKEAKKMAERINMKTVDESAQEISGQVSQPGKVRGIVKIILEVKDIEKIKEGEILVSIATNPDLLPAMKKAAAIVTDAGGITCHAAIVSRELGTPCIIGTKIATKRLKDGDLVEVDANQGLIRILS
jgi:phosphohistidine swiveling domain-containing protein